MKHLLKYNNSIILLLFVFFFLLNVNTAQEKLTVNKYLKLGPITENLPVFSHSQNINSGLKNILLAESFELNELWPAENDPFVQNSKKTLFGILHPQQTVK